MSDALRQFLDRGQLVLHLGAHKTATTSIQQALETQRAALNSRGTALILPRDLRRGGTGSEGDNHGDVPSLATQLLDFSRRDRIQRIVVSEENLIGSSGQNLARKSLYPNITRRLERLPKALNHPNVTILFSLRDYGPFVSSSATTAIRRGKTFDADALRTAFLVLHRTWLDVVCDLGALYPAANLRLWRYEDFTNAVPYIWSEIGISHQPPPLKRSFKTLSHAAMAQALDRIETSTEPVRQIIRTAAQIHPITETNPAYSLWSADEAAHLTAQYKDHWATIKANYPDMILTSA